jgi:2-polyprenyl-3-methyl-5-hydroxy-6-metoxy-1,4-benzoquinol methylase
MGERLMAWADCMYKKPVRIETGEGLQEQSKLWWTENPMSYDWRKTSQMLEGTREFYDEIDVRFFSASPFFEGDRPFARLIPFDGLKGRRVLEVGCGLGSHTQLLAGAGCEVTAIDLTARAVSLTRRRLALRGLTAEVRLMDAEHLEFADEGFDFVWSWGVIHHSSSPEAIAREVHRVLKPGGQFRVMVYSKRSLSNYLSLVRGFVSGKFFRGMSRMEVLSFYADGYIARCYTPRELQEFLRASGFSEVKTRILGATYDLVPLPGGGLPGRVKQALVSRFPKSLAKPLLARFGSLLFAVATKQPPAAGA